MAVWNVINHTEVGASQAASYEQTGFSTSYEHLYIVCNTRIDASAGASTWQRYTYMQLGTSGSVDTGSNYHYRFAANGSTPAAAANSNVAFIYMNANNQDADTAGMYSTTQIWIPNYAYSGQYKQVIYRGTRCSFASTNDTWYNQFGCGGWQNTAAIDSIKLYPSNSAVWEEHSTFTLYGINANPS